MSDDVFIVPTIFGTFAFMVWTISNNIRRSKAAREAAELHGKLLEKFTASPELLAYVESGAGRQFLEGAGSNETRPTARILNALQVGLVVGLAGAALLMVRTTQTDSDTVQFLVITGAVASAVGAGFLISALISFALCKSWGLLQPADLKR